MTRDHDSFTQEFAGESVDLPAIQATIFEPEMVKAPVLEAPEPSELNQRGLPRRNASVTGMHSDPGKLRNQEACLMPGVVCSKCGGPKTVRQGYCVSCAREVYRAWIAIPENREKRRLSQRKCAASRTDEQKARTAARRKDYRRRNAERVGAVQREWFRAYIERPGIKERRAAKKRADRLRPEVKEKTKLRAAIYNAKQEVKDRRNARRRAIYQSPLGGLHLRMSAAVRYSLRGAGKESKWLSLVGYTVEELKNHLERQFLRGMGWDNMSKWHIDHIVPLSSFSFQSEDDPEFKAAWALTNLRPVWATVNLRKQARREHLL